MTRSFAVTRNPHPVSDADRARLMDSPPFGTVFTDHIAKATWTLDGGWGDHRVEPFADLTLHPAALVLHYGQQVFEGLKAYRWADGSVHLFRPGANAARLAASARRLALPELHAQDFLGSIEALLSVDSAWVPGKPETSLYLRPTLIGTEPCLGVRPSLTVEYMLLASPVGAYFAGGVKPVSIWVAQGFHRAGAGGTGQAKTAGNYAASMLPQQQAQDNGCGQVLFLDAREDRYLEELGGMNVFVVRRDGTVETPRLTGTILEGITRASVIQLLEDQNFKVVQRDITADEVVAGVESGDIAEVFACGTAAVVTPVGRLASPDFDVTINGGKAGDVTMGIRKTLTDIQYGRAEDTYGWMQRVV